ncbi:MAG: PD-(D/E)XK nuclease family protein, partial [Acidimicrobiales bacterium]
YDEEDLLQSAIAVAADGSAPWSAAGEPLILHLLQEIPNAAGELLRVLATGRTVLVNVGSSGVAEADRHVWEAHARAGIQVGALARSGGGAERPVASRIISASDPDEEVREAIRVVMRWVREGRRLGRMAILYGQADPYARILHEQLESCGLPHNGAPVRRLGDMLLGRTVRALLALPERNYRRSDVMAVLTGADLRDGHRHGPTRAWERLSRDAEVVDGADWGERLERFASEQLSRAEEAEREEKDGLARRLRREADWVERLGDFVRRLRADVDGLAASTTWKSMADRLGRMIDQYFGDPRRLGWGAEEQTAAERVEGAISRLGALDPVGGPPPSIDTFRRALEVELDAVLPRVGHLGDGLFTSPVSSAVGLDLDCVIVLGLAEGTFPPHRMEDSILPDEVRRASGGELTERREMIHDDHRHLLAAVSAAEERVLTFPRGDMRRWGERAASRWLLDDAAALSGDPEVTTKDLATEDLAGPGSGWLRVVPSFAAGVERGAAFPSNAQELRLAAMGADPGPVEAGDGVVRAGMELARARRGDRFTRYDGNLAGLELPDYTTGKATSATRFEAWAGCPHAFLMRYLLGVEPVEDPERRLEMTPLDKGTLVHEILDRFVKEQIVLEAGGPWGEGATVRLLGIGEEVCAEFAERGLTGRSLFWRRDRARILADLRRFAGLDGGRPVHSEMRFDAVEFPLPDGRRVVFRGFIDRLDSMGDGVYRVTDYKT